MTAETVQPIPQQVEFPPVLSHQHPNGLGVQHIYRFDNGFGASVIQGPMSYGGAAGLWELAVLSPGGAIAYDTPITSDVLGHLDDTAVAELLAKVAALPPTGTISPRTGP